jgi:hypothetical protein
VADLFGKMLGGVLGFIIASLIRLFRWFASLHVRIPFHLGGAYVALISWDLVDAGSWLIALLLVAGFAAAVWKLWKPWKAYRVRNSFRRGLFATMGATLWKDLPAKRFAAVEFVSPVVVRIRFTTPEGRTDSDVIKTFPAFRASLGLVDAIVIPDDNPYDGAVSVLFCRVSPLEQVLDGTLAPVLRSADVVEDPYYWLPIGVDARGEAMEIPLFIREGGSVRQLCAGASGSGKSSILRQQLLQAVLCRHIEVIILDGKRSEFGAYEPYVEKYGRDAKDFWAQLRYLDEECSRRGEILNQNKLKDEPRESESWNHVDDGKFIVWVWDELGKIMSGFDGGQRFEAMNKLYGVLSIARSLGIAVIFSSQTFKADILTTQIRDNCFDLSLGYKMNSTQEAAYIGFDGDDAVRPDLIGGKLLKSGKFSTVGTFAMKGIGESTYGRSYFIPKGNLKKALTFARPVAAPADDSTQEEKEVAP